ncbi:GntR family transcriptional regulator [Streptomyces sp. NBC_01422]|uniref:GntR family transcriptional regulator n=1 Tax=Streptomyces sp. NBC_01422 TaxID=2903859 RepID=UPI002E2B3820|nr:GntR family transcriptional regulator [Streptomyces sp. NBC_01422]
MSKREPGKIERIAADLRVQIRQGEYSPGDQLPSVAELQARDGIAYQTARDVYRVLEREGLVYTRQGKGSFVSPFLDKINRDGTGRYQPTARSEGQARGAFSAELQRLGLAYKAESSPTVIERLRPPKAVADIFGLHHSAKALSRYRVMRAGRVSDAVDPGEGFPVQIAVSWFPADVSFDTALERQDTGPGGSKSRLAEMGFEQTRIEEALEVRLPLPIGVGGSNEAKALGISDDQPVYELLHVARTSNGRPVEAAIHVMPTNIWRLSYSWNISPS